MKKLLKSLLAFLMVFTLVGCGGNNTATNGKVVKFKVGFKLLTY